MAYDKGLAERMRRILTGREDVVEKRMFGGIAFMVRGHMSVGVVGEELMVRVGPDVYDALVKRPHARPMDFTGRPMKGFVFVAPEGFDSATTLRRWMRQGLAYAEALPAKSVSSVAPARGRPSRRLAGTRPRAAKSPT